MLNIRNKQLYNKLKGKIKYDFNLSNQTWFKSGGSTKFYFEPYDEKELKIFLSAIDKENIIEILGAGSNTLVRDGGIAGVTIKLGKKFKEFKKLENNKILVGAGYNCIKLARKLANQGLSGLEFFSGIPGTIGGAIKMNAGAYEEETSNRLISIRAISFDGQINLIKREDIKMSYRKSSFASDLIFIEAIFQCEEGNVDENLGKLKALNQKRSETQPIKSNTGGSTFKNPSSLKAWKLIRESNSSELRVGKAKISELHANFIENEGGATSEDIESLGEIIKKNVKKKFGILLDWEIKIIGNKLNSRENQ